MQIELNPPMQTLQNEINVSNRRVKKKKITEHINRPPNAFILYRSHFKESQGKGNQRNISKILGQKWKGESDEVKLKYKHLAEKKKNEHKLLYPDYKFQPKKKVVKNEAATLVKTCCLSKTNSNSDSVQNQKYINDTMEYKINTNAANFVNEKISINENQDNITDKCSTTFFNKKSISCTLENTIDCGTTNNPDENKVRYNLENSLNSASVYCAKEKTINNTLENRIDRDIDNKRNDAAYNLKNTIDCRLNSSANKIINPYVKSTIDWRSNNFKEKMIGVQNSDNALVSGCFADKAIVESKIEYTIKREAITVSSNTGIFDNTLENKKSDADAILVNNNISDQNVENAKYKNVTNYRNLCAIPASMVLLGTDKYVVDLKAIKLVSAVTQSFANQEYLSDED
ncbi:hypothetical protein HK099_007087 [Clydaea vesicula]|uniref:HMG box domain-containing protein n=1 Tax=Clydaea vesicula TaxID=447962 RepID=A0AAD5U997_9FUNG|nr:hypothetical protein HK099_007087 [Clydaea vesicula]